MPAISEIVYRLGCVQLSELSYNQWLINLKFFSIVNLNIDTMLVDIGSLNVEISTLEAQSSRHLQTRALTAPTMQILKA